MSERAALHLFEGYGIELEYMIVDQETLAVRPIADKLMEQVGGGYDREVDLGEVAWSNELALHVIEMKSNGPSSTLSGLAPKFQANVERIDGLLAPMGARLLPTAMHPFMDPSREMRLWPHEDDVIYKTFDRIFDCRGHGWANLQSTHINLPFSGDDEFGRLHAAIRLVLPLIPGLAASSPFVEGKKTALLDSRLDVYRRNSKAVPICAGRVVPERVFTRAEYEGKLLQSIYDALKPHDPEGILAHEWSNSRGCIARFERSAIEIRLLDIQECPVADIALAAVVVGAVRMLVEERYCDTQVQRKFDEVGLAAQLIDGIRDADQALITDAALLSAFGFPGKGPARQRDVWQHVIESVVAKDPGYREWAPALKLYVEQGCLARRIVSACEHAELVDVYGQLARCLAKGELFRSAIA
ncbi:MAG TPA: glutamate-cysteine ligase family protein [Polyangiales bacterium]|nr:glutamate-cysteine ligase family protein [Polyangiales bacterium]